MKQKNTICYITFSYFSKIGFYFKLYQIKLHFSMFDMAQSLLVCYKVLFRKKKHITFHIYIRFNKGLNGKCYVFYRT